jgi:hypothetical protein
MPQKRNLCLSEPELVRDQGKPGLLQPLENVCLVPEVFSEGPGIYHQIIHKVLHKFLFEVSKQCIGHPR